MNISKNNLILKFEKFLINSNFLILGVDSISHKRFVKFETLKDKKIEMFVSLSSIGNAYLPNRNNVKRRQVGHLNIEELPKNSSNKIVLLAGFYEINGKDVLATWNPFYFSHHKRNRSCYILDETICEAANKGYLKSNDCGTPVYVCDETNLSELIEAYIKDNGIL